MNSQDGPLDVKTDISSLSSRQGDARRKTYNTWIISGSLTTAAGLNLKVDFVQENITGRMKEMTWKKDGMVSVAGKWCTRCTEINTLRPEGAPPFYCLVKAGYISVRSIETVTCLCCHLLRPKDPCDAKTVEAIGQKERQERRKSLKGGQSLLNRALEKCESDNDQIELEDITSEASSLSEYQDEGSDDEYVMPKRSRPARSGPVRAVFDISESTEEEQKEKQGRVSRRRHRRSHRKPFVAAASRWSDGKSKPSHNSERKGGSHNRRSTGKRYSRCDASDSSMDEGVQETSHASRGAKGHSLHLKRSQRGGRNSKRHETDSSDSESSRHHQASSLSRQELKEQEALLALQRDVLASQMEVLACKKEVRVSFWFPQGLPF